MTEDSQGTLVLGMHRAGTSLVTHLVSRLGVAVAGELMPANAGNPRGYWENLDLVHSHDAFLARLDRRWDDPSPMPREAFTGDAADEARQRIHRTLERDLLPHPRWGIKDPRLCRLLPLWSPLLDAPATTVRYLMVLRSPEGIVASLERRDGLTPERSLMLWLRHSLEAERATRDGNRFWLDLDRFVLDPRRTLSALAAWIEPAADLDRTRTAEILDSVYDPALLHSPDAGVADRAPAIEFPWVEPVSTALRSLADGGEPAAALETLDRVRAELGRSDQLLFTAAGRSVLFDESSAADRERDEALRQRDEALRERDRLADRCRGLGESLDRIRASRSWRWTRPLREAMRRVRSANGEPRDADQG